MPCNSGMGQSWQPDYESRRKADEATAIACYILSVLEQHLGAKVETMGLSPSTLAWWAKHKEQDARQKAAEMAEAERRAMAQAAFDKLTPDERSALGIRQPR